MSEISSPYLSAIHPKTGKPVFNGSAYFGVPNTDPEQPENQRLVTIIQEDGTLIPAVQPIKTNSGGGWTYNNAPIRINIEGDFSYRLLNQNNIQVHEASRVENPIEGSESFSGAVIIEPITLTAAGQLVVNFVNIESHAAVFMLHSTISDNEPFVLGADYTITGPQQITLTSSRNVGDIIEGRQNDPTGQLLKVNEDAEALLVFPALAEAQLAAANNNLEIGDSVTLNGNGAQGDGLGGDKYEVIATAFPNDGVNYLDLNGTLQLALRENYYRFRNYAEVIGTATITAGTANIDLNQGLIQNLLLTENVGNFSITNVNPDPSFATTLTLRVQQDAIGGRSLTALSTLEWPGGIAPSTTTTPNAKDKIIMTTFDGGATYEGVSAGQDIK